jgi:uncharacterized Zn finger protein
MSNTLLSNILHSVDEEYIRARSLEEVFERGEGYFESGRVHTIFNDGDSLTCRIDGSQYEPYTVRVHALKQGRIECECTCPYDFEGWCKHIVAVLLIILDEPGNIEPAISLHEILPALEREQLLALLFHLGKNPAVKEAILQFVE